MRIRAGHSGNESRTLRFGESAVPLWVRPHLHGAHMMATTEIGAIADPEARIDALLRAMSLEEKVSLLAGSSMWYTTPVERLDIPAIKVTDGTNGARGGGGFAGGSM